MSRSSVSARSTCARIAVAPARGASSASAAAVARRAARSMPIGFVFAIAVPPVGDDANARRLSGAAPLLRPPALLGLVRFPRLTQRDRDRLLLWLSLVHLGLDVLRDDFTRRPGSKRHGIPDL